MCRPFIFITFLPPLLHYCLITINSSTTAASSSVEQEYCQPSKCGNQEIRYPFWLQETNTSNQYYYCGYEGFGLNCLTSENLMILELSGNNYFVKTINYPDHSVTLIDCDVTLNQTCPRAYRNLALGGLPLDYSSLDLNITFYFNCSSDRGRTDHVPYTNTSTLVRAVDCLRSGENVSYVSLSGAHGDDWEWFSVCEQKVVAAVIEEDILGGLIPNWPSLSGGALTQGFVLDWRPENDKCGRCESSGGCCGFKFNGSNKEFLCFCNGGTIQNDECSKGSRVNFGLKLGIGLGVAALSCVLICTVFFVFRRKTKKDINRDLESLLRNSGSLAPKRYPYSDIKKMTMSFKDKLGQGGYGTVYKGKLSGDRLVAVKFLNVAKGNGEEFINEVLSISKTSHVNVVTFLGFCLEGKRRALVYEYMPNGSLEKFIHGCSNQLGMDKLYQISLGVARGLEYLHQGCNIRILHFDIKPHNILLDEDFCPKISDFGLAKQCTKKESSVSILGARGTIGYIAPELVSRSFGGVSYKSDVYSYGMMILEIVGRRKNVSLETSHASEVFFPQWAYQHLVVDEDLRLKGIVNSEEDEIAKKIILVGLWCIQNDPSKRPTMSKVIEMLEGKLQAIATPPKPMFFSSPSTASPQSSSP